MREWAAAYARPAATCIVLWKDLLIGCRVLNIQWQSTPCSHFRVALGRRRPAAAHQSQAWLSSLTLANLWPRQHVAFFELVENYQTVVVLNLTSTAAKTAQSACLLWRAPLLSTTHFFLNDLCHANPLSSACMCAPTHK